MTTTITDHDDFKALDPFFRIIEKGLDGIADGGHFFDLLSWHHCARAGIMSAVGGTALTVSADE